VLDRLVETRKSFFFVFVKFKMIFFDFKKVEKLSPLVIRIADEVFAVNKVKVFRTNDVDKRLHLIGVVSETHWKASVERCLLFLSESLEGLKIK
jgi:hypothetical protein